MDKCPNVNSPEFKKLVANLGETTAWRIFISEGEVPEMSKVDEIIAVYPKTSTQYTFKAVEILVSERGQRWMRAHKGVFKGDKAQYWRKMQSDLQIPKAQVELLKESDTADLVELISDFVAKYGFQVQVKTATDPGMYPGSKEVSAEEAFRLGNDYYQIGAEPNREVYLKNGKEVSEKEYYNVFETAKNTSSRPTQHYQSLSVPGGTNYSELRITTPDITPSIKGHAQFAEANDIGWARVDDQVEGGKYVEGTIYDEGENFEDLRRPFKETQGGTPTKTRRVLELQSDLFQKGRDKEHLTGVISNNYEDRNSYYQEFEFDINQFRVPTPEGLYFRVGNEYTFRKNGTTGLDYDFQRPITKEEYYAQIKVTNEYGTDDKFLQLLNRDNNWVTFFIKSLIQDSAKRGYEKVLLPLGQTAQRVEGQTTYEEFVEQKKARLKQLDLREASGVTVEDIKSRNEFNGYKRNPEKGNLWQYWNGINWAQTPINDKTLLEFFQGRDKGMEEASRKEKEQIKSELQKVESEGMSAFSSIFNFYETQVTNILKKNYKVERVTDDTNYDGWLEELISKKIIDKICD